MMMLTKATPKSTRRRRAQHGTWTLLLLWGGCLTACQATASSSPGFRSYALLPSSSSSSTSSVKSSSTTEEASETGERFPRLLPFPTSISSSSDTTTTSTTSSIQGLLAWIHHPTTTESDRAAEDSRDLCSRLLRRQLGGSLPAPLTLHLPAIDDLSSEADSPQSRGVAVLTCRGATSSSSSSSSDSSAWCLCGASAQCVVVDGCPAASDGWHHSAPAATLTALFRGRLLGAEPGSAPARPITPETTEDADASLEVSTSTSPGKENNNNMNKPHLFLVMSPAEDDAMNDDNGNDSGRDDQPSPALLDQLQNLYQAVLAEMGGLTHLNGSKNLLDLYQIHLVTVRQEKDLDQLWNRAQQAAIPSPIESMPPYSTVLSKAYDKVVKSGVASRIVESPAVTQAMLLVDQVFADQSRSVRAQLMSWNNRSTRGLLMERFGPKAEALRRGTLQAYDDATLPAAGLAMVHVHRRKLRTKLQTMLDRGLEHVFASQVANLESATLKRLQRRLLQTVHDPAEKAVDANANALRREAFLFETVMDDLQIPTLGLTKDKAVRSFTPKLNDAIMAFPDSPLAKIKRTQRVKNVVSKEKKKPSQKRPAVDIGLDLVAMLRPDGFGSLQGFAGYQLGGHSITFGVHNDADDPQVIAQFGGVRPPLLRIQPKLRVDVEM